MACRPSLPVEAGPYLAIPKTDTLLQSVVEATLWLIQKIKKKEIKEEEIKEKTVLTGVILDNTKMQISTTGGKYREGVEYEVLKKFLGKGNSAGPILVIKDKQSKLEHAMKTMRILEFREEEVRAWVDLSDSGIAPSLYMFRLKDKKVEMHMEILKNVLTMQSVVGSMTPRIKAEDPALLRPFSLFVLHGLLKAAQVMHEKNWCHQDLHGENILLQEVDSGKMEVKVIDFGHASRIRDSSGNLTPDGVSDDIDEFIYIFRALYTGRGFGKSGREVEKDKKEKPREAAKELDEIIALTSTLMDPKSNWFLRPECVIKELKTKMDNDYEKALEKVAAILFPRKDLPAHTETGDHVPEVAKQWAQNNKQT